MVVLFAGEWPILMAAYFGAGSRVWHLCVFTAAGGGRGRCGGERNLQQRPLQARAQRAPPSAASLG